MSLPKPYPPTKIDYEDWDTVVDSVEWQPYQWIVYEDTLGFYAKRGDTGVITYGPLTAQALLTAVAAAVASGDRIFIKKADYEDVAVSWVTPNIYIEGEGLSTAIKPLAGSFAFTFGDGTTDVSNITACNMRFESTASAGDAIHCDHADLIRLDNIKIYNCGVGIKLEDCDKPRVMRVDITGFDEYGIYLPSPPVLCADIYIDNCYIESSDASAIGILSEEANNGLRFTNILLAGASKAGLDYGIDVEGSYSGGWFSNVVVDSIAGTGIRFRSGANQPCHDFQLENCWTQTCGEYGLEIDGSADYPCTSFLFTNCKFKLTDYACAKMEYTRRFRFEQCDFLEGALENLAANKEMTSLYVHDGTRTTEFTDCWFGWFTNTVANRAYAVEVVCDEGTAGTPTYISIRFINCHLRDPAADENARIQYHRQTVNDHVYIYGRDCATNNGDAGPDNTLTKQDAGQVGDVIDEHECQINMAFNW